MQPVNTETCEPVKVVLVSWRYETPAVHIWKGELVWFSGVKQNGQGGSKQTEAEREATGSRERRNGESVCERERLRNPLCPGGRLWCMLEDCAPNEDGQQRSIHGT